MEGSPLLIYLKFFQSINTDMSEYMWKSLNQFFCDQNIGELYSLYFVPVFT